MELLIKNAMVVDGSANAAYRADVAVSGDTIAKIGTIDTAGYETVIDADGKYLLPGFIDPHSHADAGIFNPDWAHQRIVQGITTEITGHCGPTPAPNCPEQMDLLRRIYFDLTNTGVPFDWPFSDFAGWLKAVGTQKLSANYAFLVGHGTLHAYVMGTRPDKPNAAEMTKMKELLDESLSQGAIGLGLGLSMFPGNYADTDELIELAKVVKKHEGIVVAHRRSEGAQAYESVEEMLKIARATGVRMNIAHVKVTGSRNWGKGKAILDLIWNGMQEGLDLSLDSYPYTSGYTQLFQLFPIEVWGEGAEHMLAQFRDSKRRAEIAAKLLDGTYPGITDASGGAKGVQIIQCPDQTYDKKTLDQISRMWDCDPAEAAMRLIERFGTNTMMFWALQDVEEMKMIQRCSHTMVISDGAPTNAHNHPRYMGAYSEYLDLFVRSGEMPLERAVQKMTFMPALRYNLFDRGRIKEGFKADLIVFDWAHFENNTSYEHPQGPSKGFDYVILNGEIAAVSGKYTGKGDGVIIRGC